MTKDNILIKIYASAVNDRELTRDVMHLRLSAMRDGTINEINNLMAEIDTEKCSTSLLCGLLRTTYSKAAFLSEWQSIVRKINSNNKAFEPNRAVSLLRGLSGPFKPAPWSADMDIRPNSPLTSP